MRGFTLFESLLVLSLIALSLLAAQPLWHSHSQWRLSQEATRLDYFLQLLRERSQYSASTWVLMAARDPVNETWCLAAQPELKEEEIWCDCLHPQQCQQALLYYPLTQGYILLKAAAWYPQPLSLFKNIRNSEQANCLRLQHGQEKVIFLISDFRIIQRREWRGACA